MIPSGDIAGAAILLTLLSLVLIAGEAWARLGSPSPEKSRKFVHLLSGAACLLFPFLIQSPWVVGAMAIAMSSMFAMASKAKIFKSLHSVERSSRGSEYYPVAIFLVFLISADDLWIYFSAILTLGVADAFAALIGTRYGRLTFTVQEGKKSLEGSLAFFLIATAAILLPAPFFTELPWPNLIQIALATAALLTAFEAISIRGADNLFVPVAATFILQKLAQEPLTVLVYQNLHILGLFALLSATNIGIAYLLKAERKPFNAGGILTFSLFAFTAWALGSASWALPVLTGFCLALYAWMAASYFIGVQLSIPIRATYRALLMPLVILLFANFSGDYPLYFGPYLAASAAVAAFVVTTFWRPDPDRRGPFYSKRFALLAGIAAGFVITLPPFLFHPEIGFLQGPLLITLLTAALAILNLQIVERRRRRGDEHYWPASHFLLAITAAALLFAAQHIGLVDLWQPPADETLMRYSWQPWW